MKDRSEFRALMKLCRRGKVDWLLVKSFSRLGRNTLDMLRALREIRDLGSERENMSQNIRWGVWSRETISKLLRNEKYTGDVLLQKTFVKDVLTGKQFKNQGELKQYLIQQHPTYYKQGTARTSKSRLSIARILKRRMIKCTIYIVLSTELVILAFKWDKGDWS